MAPAKKNKQPEKPNRKVTDFFQRSDPPSASRSQLRPVPSSPAAQSRPRVQQTGLSTTGTSTPLTNRQQARAQDNDPPLPPSSPPVHSPALTVISLTDSASANPDNSIISLSSGPASLDVSVISLSSGMPSRCPSVIDLCSTTSSSSPPPAVNSGLCPSSASQAAPDTSSLGLSTSVPYSSSSSQKASLQPTPHQPVSSPTSDPPKRLLFSHVEIVTPSRVRRSASATALPMSSAPPNSSPVGSAKSVARARFTMSGSSTTLHQSAGSSASASTSRSGPGAASFKRKLQQVLQEDGEDVHASASPGRPQSGVMAVQSPSPSASRSPDSSSDRPSKKTRLTPDVRAPLPSSQSGENSRLLGMDSSPAKPAPPSETSWGELLCDTSDDWRDTGSADDWNMDVNHDMPRRSVARSVPSTPPANRVRADTDPSSTALDEAEVSQALIPVGSTSPPTAPTTALPTPVSPQTAKRIKAEEILAEITARAKREIAEEALRLRSRRADADSDSEDLVSDIDSAPPKARPTTATRTFTLDPSSSPLTELSDDDEGRQGSSSDTSSSEPERRSARVRATHNRSLESKLSTSEIASSSEEKRRKPNAVLHRAPQRNKWLDSFIGEKKKKLQAGGEETSKLPNHVLEAPKKRKRPHGAAATQGIAPPGSPISTPFTPPSRASSYFDSSPSESESEESYNNAAVLGNLGDEGAQEIRRIFDSDKLERTEKRKTEEERGRLGEQRFWVVSESHSTGGWCASPLQGDPQLVQLAHILGTGDAHAFEIALGCMSCLEVGDLRAYECWLFDIAGHHPDPDIASIAYQSLVRHLRTASTRRPCSISLTQLLQTCCDIGVQPEVSMLLFPMSKRNPVVASDDQRLRRTRIFMSLVCALLSNRNLPPSDIPTAVLLVLLIGLDPTTTTEMGREISLSIEDAIKGLDPGDMSNEMAVYTRISEATSDLNVAQKCQVLELLPHCGERSRRLHRWMANDFLLRGTGRVRNIDAYILTPPVAPLLDAVDADSRTSAFAIYSATDYEALRMHTQFMECVLTDIGLYVRNNQENLNPLLDVYNALTTVYGKIMDTRAAYLDRTRAKDSIQRLRMRLHWSLPRDRGQPTQQAKLNFEAKAQTALAPGQPRGQDGRAGSGQGKARPKPRPLNAHN